MARAGVPRRKTALYAAEAQELGPSILPQHQQQQRHEQKQKQKQEQPTQFAKRRPSPLLTAPLPRRDAERHATQDQPHGCPLSSQTPPAACLSPLEHRSASKQRPGSPEDTAGKVALDIMERRRCLPRPLPRSSDSFSGEEPTTPLSSRSLASASSGPPRSPKWRPQALRTCLKEGAVSQGSKRPASRGKAVSWDAAHVTPLASRASSKEATGMMTAARSSSKGSSAKSTASCVGPKPACFSPAASRVGSEEASTHSRAGSKQAPVTPPPSLPLIMDEDSAQLNASDHDPLIAIDPNELVEDPSLVAHASVGFASPIRRLEEEDAQARAEAVQKTRSWHTSREIDDQLTDLLDHMPDRMGNPLLPRRVEEEEWTSQRRQVKVKTFAEKVVDAQDRVLEVNACVSSGTSSSRTSEAAAAHARVRERIHAINRLANRIF